MGTNLKTFLLLPYLNPESLRCGTALPEPGTIILLMVGLLLLLILRRRRRTQKPN